MLKTFFSITFHDCESKCEKKKKKNPSEECMSASVCNWSCPTEAEMMLNFPGVGSTDRNVSKIEQCLPYFIWDAKIYQAFVRKVTYFPKCASDSQR